MEDYIASIIITSHNYGNYLADAIESALGQSYPNIEVIVVDDGSTDCTKEVAKSYPVQYIFHKNQGVSVAKNRGIQQSKGQFFVCLDGDDKLTPDFVEKTLKVMMADSKVGFVCTGTKTWNEETEIENVWLPHSVYNKYALFVRWVGPLGSVFVRRTAFNSLDYGFDPNLRVHEDLDLCFRILVKGWKTKAVFEPLHWYRIHKGSLNLKTREENRRDVAPLDAKYWFRRPLRMIDSLYGKSLGRLFLLAFHPIEYLKGVQKKLQVAKWVKLHYWGSSINRQRAEDVLQETQLTVDMKVHWSRNKQLSGYYKKQLDFLEFELKKIIRSDIQNKIYVNS